MWGQITTGGGHSQLQKTMSVLDVLVIMKSSFIWSEHDIGEWWREELQESMIAARKEENWLTEERGEYHEGVSAISVTVADNFSLYLYVLVHLLTTFRGKYQPKETVERTVTDDPTTERNFQ